MPKPPGLSLGISPEGQPRFSVTRSSRAEDSIYEAVEEAINEGMTPTRFVDIARSAWTTTLEEQATAADNEFKNLKK